MQGRICRSVTVPLLIFLPLFANAQVVVNEVMYAPLDVAESFNEWIEIYNSGSDSVDLTTLQICGKDVVEGYIKSSDPDLNINKATGLILVGGQYAIITDGGSGTEVYENYNVDNSALALSVSAASICGGLANTTAKTIELSGPFSDSISYDTSKANKDGNSLQLQTDGTWIAAVPTPGAVNATGSTTPITDDEEDDDTTATSTSSTSSSVSPSSPSSSVHYGSGSLSTKRREVKVDLSAGRDRLGSVGSPLEFKVESDVEYARNSIFKWNFGDGVEKIGDVLNHTYEYPGEYAVVLNVSLSQGKAVARLNVKIIEPEILITLATADRVEIKNDSQYEVSLFGRALVSGGKIFAFPQDTIIKAGQKISFSSPATGIAPTAIGDVSLVVVGTEVKPQQIMVKISEQKAEQIASIQTKIRELQQRLAVAVERENHNRATSNMVIQPAEEEELKESPQTALVLDAVQESRDTVSWLKTIQRFFLRTR